MTAAADVQVKTPANDFVLTRIFDAPRALVFKAWTDPKHLAQWWGPKDFTNPVCELDLRPGGAYRIVMRSPQGSEHPMRGVFLEIAAPERLVMSVDIDILKMIMTVTFEERAGKTKVTVAQRFDTTADRETNVKMGAVAGWTQSFERLDALLDNLDAALQRETA